MPTLAILLHERDRDFEKSPYLIQPMLQQWQARGFRTITLRGIQRYEPADLLIPHLDLTVTPPEYADFFQRYPRVLNRHVLDIAKSSFSANLLRDGDAYTGPAIIKTNGNYGGKPDKQLGAIGPRPLAARLLWPFIKLRHRLTGAHTWRYLEQMPPDDYPVYESLRDVPRGAFKNPHLVVEKFMAERIGEDYCLRYYGFLGDRETSLLLKSRNRVAKGASIHDVEECPIQEELRAMRRQLKFDYGKFDYVLRDGRVVLFDINRTPSSTVLKRFNLYEPVAQHLAGGIDALLGEAAPGS